MRKVLPLIVAISAFFLLLPGLSARAEESPIGPRQIEKQIHSNL